MRGIIAYPDAHEKWKPYALKCANALLEKEKVDAIISSSSPVTSHLIARELKNKWRIPWIADLRDLWTQNHNYYYGSMRKFVEQRLEVNTLKTADALVTVSPLWAEDLKKLHKKKIIYSISNGFDPDLLRSKEKNLASKFSITYTGPIYTGKHNTGEFLNALRDLFDDKLINPNELK